jgi:hypothetical protein
MIALQICVLTVSTMILGWNLARLQDEWWL